MKSFGIILLLTLLSTPFYGATKENNDSIYFSYYLNSDENYYIYSNIANVRNGADINSDVIAKLECGDEVSFIDYEKEHTINNLIGRWLKINFTKDGTKQEGYIWEGNISPKQLRRNDVKFIFGIEEYTGDRNNIKWQLKALQNKKVISINKFTNPYVGFFSANIIDDAGIIDVDKVIRLGFSGESCGVPSINHFFAWDNKDLFYIDNAYSVGDADAYAYSESIVFPKGHDSNYSNIILKLISEYINPEYNDIKISKDDPDSKYQTQIYLWDGKKLIRQQESLEDLGKSYK